MSEVSCRPPDDPHLIELLRRIAERDEAAFSDFYDQLHRVLFSLVLRVLRTEAEAEEVLQEAFWQIWEKAHTYRPELGSPFSWSVTLARHKAIDRLRSTSRHLQRIDLARTRGTEPEYVEHGAEAALDQDTAALAVRAALAQLPRDQVRAIELAFFDGLTHEEIAAALDTPVGTIKARIRRGLQRLRAPLSRVRLAGSMEGSV